jgi:Rrf2 family protein
MLHYTKTAGYAIHALSSIGRAYPGTRLVREVAEESGLMKPYAAKIVNQLVHHGLLTGKRGYRGGVTLARSPEDISLFEIVQAVEGDARVSRCVFGLESCPADGRCPAHEAWNRMGKQVEAALKATTLRAVMNSTRVPTVTAAPLTRPTFPIPVSQPLAHPAHARQQHVFAH